MIYTLTLNPAIDMAISVNEIKANHVNRTNYVDYLASGKGINVSLVLNHFKVSTHAIGIFGGFTGQYIINELNKLNINVSAIYEDGITRINTFINVAKDEYKFVNPGFKVSNNCLNKLLDLLDKLLKDEDYLVISGSFPNGLKNSYLKDILNVCNLKKSKIILDISNSILKDLLEFNPLLIKPNNDELLEIFNLESDNHQKAKESLIKLNKLGAKNILLTMGENGLYFYNGINCFYCNSPKINLVSSACAGDSALAAFLSIWLNKNQNDDINYALRLASSTGADVASSLNLGDFKNIEKFLLKTKVKIL